MTDAAGDFGIARSSAAKLRALFEEASGLQRVWIFGSRGRGDARPDSDIDLAFDAPGWTFADHAGLAGRIESLNLLYKVDAVLLQDTLDPAFRAAIERDRKLFWEIRLRPASREGAAQLKKFQSETLAQLDRYLDHLVQCRRQSEQQLAHLRAMEGAEDLALQARDFPRKAWAAMQKSGALPPKFAVHPHSSRFDGAGRAIPNVCFKVPTGGGKTLLAAASLGKVFNAYLERHVGFVLWIVPNDAIYRQTLRTLADRDHPYRQMLNLAGAGRVKILEKNSPLTRLDVDSHLCVMVLMLAAASRQNKETLRFFRDRGNVLGFLPREDDIEAHWKLLADVPNLDAYGSPWARPEEARAQKGSIVKSSLGNVMRLVRPMVVIDEGHHAYTETALATLDGFNPCFMLELSATPRIGSGEAGGDGGGSNILVDVRGTDLDEAEMIKLPIHVDVRHWTDWRSCLAESVRRLDMLQREAEVLQGETARYVRPILLVQVERTGRDQIDAGFIHATHVREYLAQLGLTERQIREKTSEKDEIGDEELLSPASEVRVIITKQALQEGWDCPFAYVLCALSASRGKRAMTQLVGRILRMPNVAKTGRPALDACYVLCHDASTGEVVKAIKQSLEGEGMGDLGIAVHGDAGDPEVPKPVPLMRRPELAQLRIFLPRVTWVGPDGARRELQYESDVLSRLDWDGLQPDELARSWAPSPGASAVDMHLEVGLSILDDESAPLRNALQSLSQRVDGARLVRTLADLVPNPWLLWEWVSAVLARLRKTWDDTAIALSDASLIERLRIDVEAERDRLAHDVFCRLVAAGRIEFRLRADGTDYELPHDDLLQIAGKTDKLTRPDGFSDIGKSLLAPALRTPDMNNFEALFAGYLDEQAALRWWHRNVARTQYGLQGWKRHKVYPDFVFGFLTQGADSRVVVLETKGVHLAGNSDTAYKQALLAALTEAYCDERFRSSGELALEGARETIECDLVFNEAWRSTMAARYFS
ncbi:MAG TPA: DEAD/DEAH box helicase family protein [Ramlibacter sp.]|uniref:DEAD/DEAH box helicase family protein n=1 Tax=Ramlibacter sp. TaxID=1917967 RepID=UPI002BBC7A8A|nr:DEAD/DEAH box helicase family protein [Ramlibacter sp.]HVZ45466.1 DEAD/DEAH box helicase family protein [Ramlibacter sp.]